MNIEKSLRDVLKATAAFIEKMNPNHDERGRFSSGGGGGSIGGSGAEAKSHSLMSQRFKTLVQAETAMKRVRHETGRDVKVLRDSSAAAGKSYLLSFVSQPWARRVGVDALVRRSLVRMSSPDPELFNIDKGEGNPNHDEREGNPNHDERGRFSSGGGGGKESGDR